MIQFIPNKNNGFKWYTNNKGVYFKGFFYDNLNNIVEAENAIEVLNSIDSTERFIESINSLNGMYSIVILKDDFCYVTSDSTRVFPIFYKKSKDSFVLSDDINLLNTDKNIIYDKIAQKEFESFGCCLGNKTLLKDIYQIQSSEYLILKEHKILKNGFSFSIAVQEYTTKNYKDLKKTISTKFENTFERLINSLNGQTAVIPLSGGFDSRLIATFLKQHNYKNVICYTYGKKGNRDMELSKKIASKLNFKWHFIEYTDDLIEGFLDTSIFKSYCSFTFHHASMLFLQEYFAVKHLKEYNLIPDDAIFIPGHDGGALAGGYIVKLIPENIKDNHQIAKSICKSFFSTKRNNSHLNLVSQNLLNFNSNYLELKPHSVYEDFIYKEISSKVIFNSANVYDFFGYEYRLPFCDKELQNSFKNLDLKLKINKKIYIDIISDFFKKFDLNLKKEIQPSLLIVKVQNIKNAIKPFLPYFIIKRKNIENDWLNAQKMTDELEKNLEKNNLSFNKRKKHFNDVNKQWYIYYCKKLIR